MNYIKLHKIVKSGYVEGGSDEGVIREVAVNGSKIVMLEPNEDYTTVTFSTDESIEVEENIDLILSYLNS